MYLTCFFLCALTVYHVSGENLNDEQISDSSVAGIVRKLSQESKNKIMKELKDEGNKCYQKFDQVSNRVIRPKDSLSNGATFIGSELAVDCVKACCNHTHPKCDLVLYKVDIADAKHCFLFKCFNETKNENCCLFSNKANYITFTRHYDVEDSLESLEDHAKSPVAEKTIADESTTPSNGAAMDSLMHLEPGKEPLELEEKAQESSTAAQESTTAMANEAVESSSAKEEVVYVEVPDEADTAILPLALGLAVTMMVLLMVICRIHIMKKKLKQGRGKYMKMKMDESDYLINGMYL